MAARTNFGPTLAAITALLVSISCAGAMHGQMFAGGRLIASSAQRGYLPFIFGWLGSPFSFTRDLQAIRDSMQSVGELSATSQDSIVSAVWPTGSVAGSVAGS